MTQRVADQKIAEQVAEVRDALNKTTADATQQMVAAMRDELDRHQRAVTGESMEHRRNMYAILSRFKVHTDQV